MKLDTDTFTYIESQIKKRNQDMSKHHSRMATFPYPSKLLKERKDLALPIVCVNENVYILPGIPSLFKVLLNSLIPRLERLSGSKFYRIEIATKLSEVDIATVLTQTQEKVDALGIKIGSYPLWGKNEQGIRVVVSISGKDESKVKETSQDIIKDIQGWQVIKSHL